MVTYEFTRADIELFASLKKNKFGKRRTLEILDAFMKFLELEKPRLIASSDHATPRVPPKNHRAKVEKLENEIARLKNKK